MQLASDGCCSRELCEFAVLKLRAGSAYVCDGAHFDAIRCSDGSSVTCRCNLVEQPSILIIQVLTTLGMHAFCHNSGWNMTVAVEGISLLNGTHDWVPRLSRPPSTPRLSRLPSTSMPFRAHPPHPIFITSNPFLTLCAHYPVVALCGGILNQCRSRYIAKMYCGLFCRIRYIGCYCFASQPCRSLEIDDLMHSIFGVSVCAVTSYLQNRFPTISIVVGWLVVVLPLT
jgi:hypothetical protein